MGVTSSDINDVAMSGSVLGFLGGGSNSEYSFWVIEIEISVLAMRTASTAIGFLIDPRIV